MNASNWAVGAALFMGSIRAVELFRSAPKAGVVNVAVLGALAEGRGSDLSRMLAGVGRAPYFALVRALLEPSEKLASGDERAVRKRLEHDMMRGLALANVALRRFAWLDSFALAAIAFAGVSAALDRNATPVLALELLAATLLWLANVRARRSIATRMYAGAQALVDGLVKSLDMIRRANPALGADEATER